MNGAKAISKEEIDYRLYQGRNDDIRRKNTLLEYCKNKSVLDFGCGFGGFIKEISKTVKSVAGVELSACEREYLKKVGYRVEKNIDNYKEKFDVITLFHVFEHLLNPNFLLAQRNYTFL